jgi:hypothetical protein
MLKFSIIFVLMSMSMKNIFCAFYDIFLFNNNCIFEILWNKPLKQVKRKKKF